MQSPRYLLTGVIVVGVIALFTSVSFSEKEHSEGDVKPLKDSAAALQQSHPDFAQGLRDQVNEEEADEKQRSGTGMGRSDFGSGSVDDPDKSD
jgi:hypothetical protein